MSSVKLIHMQMGKHLENVSCYDHGQNIMRIFNVLPNFPFTTSEMKPDYDKQTGIYTSCLTSCRTT